MEQEYRNVTRLRIRTWLTARLARDYRSSAASAAFEEVVAKQENGALCVSIGGGPTRGHPKLVNLNIGLFPNVDVVGDAYCLPYAQGSVDAVCCEAVLEHLEFPDRAVSEMYRVLKPGGQVFSATPFLQLFHAYPDHYQNFTLEGHRRLFERAGFRVTASDVCVGPTVAMAILLSNYVKVFAPFRALGLIASILVRVPALVLTPLDLYLNRHPQAHVLASTTFVHAVKVDSQAAVGNP